MSTNTSYWLNFFREAGLPEKIGTKYAVLFAGERVDPSMLGEISKDILKDMGVTAMGDIIAILRHARAIMDKDNEEKTLEGMMRSTPAGRMIAHYVGNSSEKTTRSPEKVSPPRKTTTVDNSRAAKRPVPDAGVNYKVVLPKGTTPKTRAILEQMQKNKAAKAAHSSMEADKVETRSGSVFSRLSVQSGPATKQQNASSKSDASVFNRLGPRKPGDFAANASSAAATSAEYRGILKLTPGVKRRISEAPTTTGAAASAISASSPPKRVRLNAKVVQAEATSTTHSEGIFAGSRRPSAQGSVHSRLGGVKEGSGVGSRLGSIGSAKQTAQPFRVTGAAPVLSGPRPPRRVTPEIEGRYRVVMPRGTTPKTRAILQKLRDARGQGDSRTTRQRIVWDL